MEHTIAGIHLPPPLPGSPSLKIIMTFMKTSAPKFSSIYWDDNLFMFKPQGT